MRGTSRGFSLIELLFVILVVSIIGAIAMPFLQKARMTALEKNALAAVRTLTNAEINYHSRQHRYATLAELISAGLVEESFSNGIHSGYLFSVENLSAEHFEVVAVPLVPGSTGNKGYYADETGVIRYSHDGSTPTADSPPVE